MFDAYNPVVLYAWPVAQLVFEVLAEGGGGRVGAGPIEVTASIT